MLPLIFNDNCFGTKLFTKEKIDSVALLKHLEEGHEDLVLASLRNGAGDASSELLQKAAEKGAIRVVRAAVKEGVKVESSHLFAACRATNKAARLETVQFLMNQGAINVNVTDNNGYTPLMHIIEEEGVDDDLIKLFTEKKAEIKDPLCLALIRESARKIAPLLNITKAQAKEYVKKRPVKSILANVNGIEGPYCIARASEMVQYAKKMLDTLPHEVNGKAVIEMNAALVNLNQQSHDDIVDAIQNNQAVVLPLGYRTHIVTLSFYNGYMVICNRGRGCKEGRNTFDVFRVDPKKFTREILETLIQMRYHGNKDEFTDYYYDQLPSFLSPLSSSDPVKDEICLWMEELSPKIQRVGNCGWANLKDGLFALDALMRFTERSKSVEGIKPEDVARIQEEAKLFAKGFSDHARLSSIDLYFSEEIPDDLDLLSEAVRKIRKRKLAIPFSRYPFLSDFI